MLGWLAGERAPQLIGGEGARVLMCLAATSMARACPTPGDGRPAGRPTDPPDRTRGRAAGAGGGGLAGRGAHRRHVAPSERTADELDAQERATLGAFVAGLPARMAAVAACGVPETLFAVHPGNVRGSPGAMILIDWGEAGVGHPLLDQAAMFSSIGGDEGAAVRAHWARRWREAKRLAVIRSPPLRCCGRWRSPSRRRSTGTSSTTSSPRSTPTARRSGRPLAPRGRRPGRDDRRLSARQALSGDAPGEKP